MHSMVNHMLNLSLEDREQHNRTLCKNINNMDFVVHNSACIGYTGESGKLIIYPDTDIKSDITPSGLSMFVLQGSIQQSYALDNPILSEGKEFSDKIKRLTANIEVFCLVKKNQLKKFHEKVSDKTKNQTSVIFTNISDILKPVLVKPQVYANQETAFNIEDQILKIAKLNNVEFRKCTPAGPEEAASRLYLNDNIEKEEQSSNDELALLTTAWHPETPTSQNDNVPQSALLESTVDDSASSTSKSSCCFKTCNR